jgi:branched-chain amino acid aminotransferase
MNLNHNGKIIANDTLLFSASDRLVKYNDGVFASMRYSKGEARFLAAHIARLQESAAFLKLQPFGNFKRWQDIPLSFWQAEIAKIFEQSKPENDAAFRLRIQLYRVGEGLFTPKTNETGFIITAEPINVLTEKTFQKSGLTIGFSEEVRLAAHAQAEYAFLKIANATPYILANIERQARNLDEILLFDNKGYLVEAASSNVLCFAENTLFYTDHTVQGGYSGVTQQIIIEKIAPSLGITTQKMRLHQRVFHTLEEVILVNAVQEIRFAAQLKTENSVIKYKQTDIAKRLFDALLNQ